MKSSMPFKRDLALQNTPPSKQPLKTDLGAPTHALVPCWMPKSLPTRNKCMGWFTPALKTQPRIENEDDVT